MMAAIIQSYTVQLNNQQTGFLRGELVIETEQSDEALVSRARFIASRPIALTIPTNTIFVDYEELSKMMKANNYAAYAVNRLGGWTAHYSPPGGDIRSISDDDDNDIVFGSEDEASAAAAVRLIEVLNTQHRNTRSNLRKRSSIGVERINGQELAQLIKDSGLNAAKFSDVVGMRGDHLAEMLSDKRKVSPQVHLIALLFAESDDALSIAQE